MNTDNNIKKIVLELKKHFDDKNGIFTCFCTQGVQIEGWLKGELLYFLSQLKETGKINDFDREVKSPVSNQKIDFKLELKTNNNIEIIWLELKHWLIGYQKVKFFKCQVDQVPQEG